MVFFDSSHTLCALTSQDGRQIHVGQIPHCFVRFDITFSA